MYSKTNKVLSIAMSAAILLTNIMTPMKVYADEVNEPAQDLESEMPLETEPVSYYLTLPYYEEVSYSVDKNHVETADAQDKDIRLAYHEEERVEFSFQTADTVQVMEIYLKDNEKQEVPFSIDEDRKVSLAMPAKDLDLTLVLEDIPVPAAALETEQVVETEQAVETERTVGTESTMENPVNQDGGINEFDLTAQEGSAKTDGESNPEEPGIVLTAETEADGLPTQGSILTVDTLTIPLMDVDFDPKTDFTHISLSSEMDHVELIDYPFFC